jgi:hypothetical protein
MWTLILAQIPDSYIASSVTADQLSLIRVDYNIIDRDTMTVIALNISSTSIPYLDSAVLGACDHPFPFTVESNACHIVRMPVKGQDCIWIRPLDIEKLDGMVTGSS